MTSKKELSRALDIVKQAISEVIEGKELHHES